MIPVGSARFVFTGILTSGEIFNTGFWGFFNDTQPDEGTFDSCTAGIETSFSNTSAGTAFKDAFEGMNGSTVILNTIKGYYYGDTSGHATLQALHLIASPWIGTAGLSMPNQVALVATLLTGRPGRSRRGRMYVPASGVGVDASGQVGATVRASLCGGVAHGMTHLAANSVPPVTPSVVSSTLSNALAVSQVRVDSRLDIQRRRANREVIEGTSVVDV